jgi:hypothetical protein
MSRPCGECGAFSNNAIITSAGCIGFHRVSVPLCAEHYAIAKREGVRALSNAYQQAREAVNAQKTKRDRELGLG